MTKSNLGPMPEAVAYRLVGDSEHEAARVAWEGTTGHRAADLLVTRDDDGEGAGPRDEAVAFLEDLLGAGPVAAKVARTEAKEAGIAARTLDRAKKTLGVESVKLGAPGESGRWVWTLADRRTPPEAEERQSQVVAMFGECGVLREDDGAA